MIRKNPTIKNLTRDVGAQNLAMLRMSNLKAAKTKDALAVEKNQRKVLILSLTEEMISLTRM